MRIYFDPSLLIALYLPEARTPSLRAWLSQLGSPIDLNVWQELEWKFSRSSSAEERAGVRSRFPPGWPARRAPLGASRPA
ncbi:MAG: type II toxin-antitoxin system VapC family toxin [Verrucomicrobia bacterium]|nr:type II toxin-antitoxin system VapC family toxin [Verrucomicrobiota bacterium]